MQSRIKQSPGLYVLIAALIALTFVLDTMGELGLAVWALYVAPLILSLQSTRPALPLLLGFLTSVLVAVGYFLTAPVLDPLVTALAPWNRGIIMVVLCLLGVFGRLFVANKVRMLQEDWIKQGRTELALVMRGEQELRELGKNIASFLARYLGAPLSCSFIINDSGELIPCGGFAMGASITPSKAFTIGESLVGQAATEPQTLVIDDVPEDYVQVRSGIGAAIPRTLVIVPARADGIVTGVVELGFFSPPSPASRDLLERAAEPIGVAFRSARQRMRKAELLEETRRQAEELQEQKHELAVTNEELEEQTQALKASQARLEAQHAELEETNATLTEQAHTLQAQQEQLLLTRDLLQRKASELGRSSRYKSEFLANMSHELRTPLNSTLILAKLLADNKPGNLSEEQVQFASNIYTAGNDLLALINDILDLAKIESGKTEVNLEPVHLARHLEGIEGRFRQMAKDKNLSLSVSIDAGCPGTVETDPRRLQQILTNLLSNAIKFTQEGSIELRAAPSASGQVAITVEDTGIGIPSDQHAVIFEAFRQADGTTSRRHGGTGLGLSISRELAFLLGGDIRLESAPMEGSRFILTLPTRPEAIRNEPTLTAAAPGALRPVIDPAPPRAPIAAFDDDRDAPGDSSRIVLAIEDDPIFASILRDLARDLNFRCVVARSAEEGLQLIREFRPVAVVLDIGLPDHSGLAVLELLKRGPETRHIPIHVVSLHDYQQVALEMGAIGYALKPVKHEELAAAFARLEAHLSRHVRKILVVEDEDIQRDAIHRLLDVDGVEITSVATADEALEKLRSTTFDCVVLDLMLQETSGFDLLARMGEDETSCPPVIVYTARALTAEEEGRLRQHAKSIIVKGARSPERLLEEVTLFLHQVESELPPEKRRMLQVARDREAIFEGRRILLVEDDVRNLFALTSALEPKGATIEIARNGKEALDRIHRGPPVDLVLMDIMMPEMDGLTATREIRKQTHYAELPIIALTAKAMPNDRQECLDAGANDYLAKPIVLDKLLSMVRVWMPR